VKHCGFHFQPSDFFTFPDRTGHRREIKVARPVPEPKALESLGFEQSSASETAPIEVNVCLQKRSDSEQSQPSKQRLAFSKFRLS
jgi:hypothetical protein